ncbi:MAG: DEAD/DEAH box helicase [Pirellulaceae bacterium]
MNALPTEEQIPRTAADRLAMLRQMQSDLPTLVAFYRQRGLHVQAILPELTDFVFDANEGRLTAHAKSGGCRVHAYLSGVFDGRQMVPNGVADVTGSCKDFRRRQGCAHTLAAVKRLAAILDDKSHPLREQLFQLSQSEAWRGALRLVDQFLANKPVEQQVPEELQTRVVWRAEFTQQEMPNGTTRIAFDVAACQQKLGKNGRWTKGRRLSLESLRPDDPALHEAERRIGLKYQQFVHSYNYRYGYGNASSLGAYDILLELIGHPLVFWADRPDVPVEIARGSFGVAVSERPGGWIVQPAVDGKVRPGETLWSKNGEKFEKPIWVDRAGNRVVLCEVDSGLVTLVAKLGSIDEPIPPAGQPTLLEKLAILQARLPVVLPESLTGGTEVADRRLVLRLTPQQPQGVGAELVVVPVEGGAAYAPGGGPAAIAVLREGKQFRYERDLADERRRASEIAEQLRLAMFATSKPFTWLLPTLDDALDLLAQLADEPLEDLLVQWPEGDRRSVSRTVQAGALRVQIESQQDWFGLSGTVEIDGQEIELARILAAMRKGSRYIEVAPQQYVRLAQTLRQSLEAIDDASYETKSGKRELDISAAPVLQQLCDPSVELKACLAWDESLRRLHAAQNLSPEPPITLQAELRDYQLDGYRWLSRLAAWGMGGCLADDMGLGKTVQTLAALIDRAEEGPALVIAPTSVGFNWIREAERFAPTLRPILYHETDREEVLQDLTAGDVLVVSYGLLLRDVAKLAKIEWGTLVLDEAQKIKNSVTKTAQAVRQIDARWRLALTGTPVENHLGEFWSIFRAVCPGLLGSWERFRTKFAEPIERQKDPVRRRALSRLIRPFILRRTKSEVLQELPARTEIVRTAELSAEERRRYQAARLAAIADLAMPGEKSKTEDKRFQILAALTRLRQLACHPQLVDADWPGGSAKLELFMEIALELREGGHRALVFSQFVQHLSLIRGALDAAGISYQYLDGQTPTGERQKRVDAFQHGEGELFLISLKAGGTGLNLTAADYVIHMDPWWNPAVEDQATDRAHRIGQLRPVTVYRLVAKDTIEEQILALHASKRSLVADVLAGTDQAGKLSSQDLVALIRGEQAAENLASV